MQTRPSRKGRFFGFTLVVLGVGVACSAGKGSGGSGIRGNGGSGANGGAGIITGNGGSTSNGGSTIITTNGGSGTVVVNLPKCDASTPCPDAATQVCVAQAMGGVCSTKGAACTKDSDCQNDTYCCAGDCRIDKNPAGVCVTGDSRPTNSMCTTAIAVGVFAPDLQCSWTTPPAGDPYPNSKQVSTTPLVADLPNDSASAGEIVIVTMDKTGGESGEGRIRILNGQTCAHEEVISDGAGVSYAATPAIADLDGDGKLEIVTRLNSGGTVAYTWKGTKFGVMWTSDSPGGMAAWDGPSLVDLNNDGKPEVVLRGGVVLNGTTGAVLAPANPAIALASDPVVGDLDHDGTMDLVANQVFSWTGSGWSMKYPGINADPSKAPAFYAYADFGTPMAGGGFDHTKKDGIAEVVATGRVGNDGSTGMVGIYTLQGQAVMRVDLPAHASCTNGQELGERGGPPTIGDFDGDGMPEVASAGAYAYRVFDLDCESGASATCKDKYIRWAQDSQDCTSGSTGSTIFDFEGDGAAEAIYADECFVRVYSGKTGEVLFSQFRASATWWEQPIVADPDHSDRSKLIFGSSAAFSTYQACGPQTAEPRSPASAVRQENGFVDKEDHGLRCKTDADCASMKCDTGFCRCTTDASCGSKWKLSTTAPDNDNESGLVCTSPVAGTPGTGNVCRMQHGTQVFDNSLADSYFAGVRVYRDKLDRWASSRPLWNQHAYNISNIGDDGKVPATASFKPNYLDPALNNFRQNRQGSTSADLADITGALDGADACATNADGSVTFTGKICNRGLRGVGAAMPATFYVGAVSDGKSVCSTQTDGPVPVGACKNIACNVAGATVADNSVITMVVNDAGKGSRITDECNYDNNTASTTIASCPVVH